MTADSALATDAAEPVHPPHVLVVDDDPALRELLQGYLAEADMRVSAVDNGRRLFEVFDQEAIDLVVLDLRLPGEDGLQLARQLRERAPVPVILLTGRAEEADRVMGLELGADDYVSKPFSPRELVARVRARLRRSAVQAAGGSSGEGWVERGEFAVDRGGHRIRYRGQALDLTRYEYALLEALLQRPGAILSRAQLMDRGWDSDAESGDRTVDTHVKTLRAKLRAAGAEPDPIRTHRGLGYAIEA